MCVCVCMYVCMCVCMYVSIYVCMYVLYCMYVSNYGGNLICFKRILTQSAHI